MEKRGDLNEYSKSDFNPMKKVTLIDAGGFYVADDENKDKLSKPVRVFPMPGSSGVNRGGDKFEK